MKKHSIVGVSVSLVATALLGCSAGEGNPSPVAGDEASAHAEIEVQGVDVGDTEPGRAVQRTVLAEVQASGTTVTFVEVGSDADRVIALEIMGSLGQASPVQELLRDQRLTMLELFKALESDGAEPPAALVALHAEQAEAFGRADATVLEVAFDADAPVAKSSTTCSNLIFNHDPADWTAFNKRSKNDRSGTDTLYVGGDSTFHTGNYVTVGACNEGSSTMTVIASHEIKDDGDGWFHSPTYNLGAGGYFLYFPWRDVEWTNCQVGGLIVPCATGTRYRVQGSGSGPYHLKTAELSEVIE